MTHNRYALIIASAAFVAWIGWFLVITKLSPFESTGLSLTFFFLTLFIATTATFAVLGFYFRMWLFRNEVFYRHINTALRQGFFLSLIIIFCLAFQMMKVLSWWSGSLLVVIAVLLESYFSSRDSELSS